MTSDDERVRRPKPERYGPNRDWRTMFDAMASGARPPAGDEGAPDGEGGTAFTDAVSRSVDLGYRVVDSYLRQGQRTAQRFGQASYGPDAAVADARELSDRMAQYVSEFLGLWFEFVQLASSGNGPLRRAAPDADAAPPAPAPPADVEPSHEAAPGPGASPAGNLRVTVDLVSIHPTEVSLDLRPELHAASLVVHGLRAMEPEKPRLGDVSFRAGDATAPAVLRIRVPADQPPGVYSGLIVDAETSRPAGTLSVRIAGRDG